MPRYFAPITKEELRDKIIEAWLQHPDRDDYHDEEDEGGEIDAELGDREVGRMARIRHEWASLTPKIKQDFKVNVDFENVNCGKHHQWSHEEYDRRRALKDAGQNVLVTGYTDLLDPNDQMNVLMGLNTLTNGLTFVGVYAGGDWETPVFFIIYWDGKNLRAYIPTDGNPWNTDTKQAYGNDEEEDSANMRKRWPDLYGEDDYPEAPDFDPKAILNDILWRIEPKK